MDCSATYQVSGTITHNSGGTTSLNLNGTNPNPATCGGLLFAANQAVQVNIANDTCDNAAGTWSNSTTSGTLTMTKPADTVDLTPAQSTVASCWADSCGGGSPGVMLFEDTLGSSKSMAGRQVYEAQNGASNDSCWYNGSPYEPYHLSGGGWYVGYYGFGNKVSFDYVGLDPQIYQWYYSQGKTPCVMSAPQQMLIYKNGGSESYFQTTITISMQPPWYGVAKNGVQAWRQF